MPAVKPPFVANINRGHPLSRGCIFALPLHEGAGTKVKDVVSALQGTLTTMAPDSDWVGSPHGWSLDFDGSDDYISFGNPGQMTGEMTLLATLRPDSSAASVKVVVSKGGGNEFNLNHGRTSNKWEAVWGVTIILTSTSAWAPGSWYRVAMVRRGSAGAWTAELYVDGTADGSTGSAVNPTGSGILAVGRLSGGTLNWAGNVAEVRLYNRALSAKEIAEDAADPFAVYREDPFVFPPSGSVVTAVVNAVRRLYLFGKSMLMRAFRR